MRRCAWPSVPIVSCEHLRGGYCGAGPRASPGDIPWRFYKEEEEEDTKEDGDEGEDEEEEEEEEEEEDEEEEEEEDEVTHALASLPKDWAKDVVEAEEKAGK